jgi:hypothetical protein
MAEYWNFACLFMLIKFLKLVQRKGGTSFFVNFSFIFLDRARPAMVESSRGPELVGQLQGDQGGTRTESLSA